MLVVGGEAPVSRPGLTLTGEVMRWRDGRTREEFRLHLDSLQDGRRLKRALAEAATRRNTFWGFLRMLWN